MLYHYIIYRVVARPRVADAALARNWFFEVGISLASIGAFCARIIYIYIYIILYASCARVMPSGVLCDHRRFVTTAVVGMVSDIVLYII